ncbi:MAG: hypothetical protein KBB86_03025 [Candidatus Pacebacteria bacterium]|nr:hypothetical protein [Candidatus Paceibacterota bacterium]
MNTAKTKPFVIIASQSWWYYDPIKERLEYEGLIGGSISLGVAEEVLRAIPEKGPCLIIVDSPVGHEGNEDHKGVSTGTRIIIRECKKKNSDCKIMLLTVEPFDLKPEEFDFYVNSLERNSLEKVLSIVKNF